METPALIEPDALGEFTIDREELTAASKADMNTLAALAAPDDATLDFPEIFLQLWVMLTSASLKVRDFSKFAIGLPRGHGKTFVIKLFIIYCILFTNKQFILIIGATADLAENILADVRDMLDSSNIIALFGNWRHSMETDRQNFKKFTFQGRPIIIKAVGAGTAMRGITVKNKRPDLMIFDDAQTVDCSQSASEAQKFAAWFTGTALKAKNPKSCTFIYIGNMYKDLEIQKNFYGCMLRNLQKNSAWTSFIVGGILADGKALWEELQPLDQLLEELRQDIELQQEEIFYAEVLNDPAAIASRLLDTQILEPFVRPPDEQPLGSFIIIDPSSGKKKANIDDLVIGYFEVHDGRPILMELRSGKLSPLECIHECFKICLSTGCACVIAEDVAYQSTLLFWFEHVAEQQGLEGINFFPINPKGVSKTVRIINFFKQWMQKEVQVAEPLQATVVSQATRFNPLKRDNIDDILDVCAYAQQVMLEHPQDIHTIQGSYTTLDMSGLPSPDDYINQTSAF